MVARTVGDIRRCASRVDEGGWTVCGVDGAGRHDGVILDTGVWRPVG